MAENETTPAAEALRAEVRDIATNPSNPRHVGYTRNDPQVAAYLGQRYAEVYGSGAVDVSSGVDVQGSGQGPGAPESAHAASAALESDPMFQSEVAEALRQRFGDGYAGTLEGIRATGEQLVHAAGDKGFDDLEAWLLDGLSPGATVQAHVLQS